MTRYLFKRESERGLCCRNEATNKCSLSLQLRRLYLLPSSDVCRDEKEASSLLHHFHPRLQKKPLFSLFPDVLGPGVQAVELLSSDTV